jgi:hypothetical protein
MRRRSRCMQSQLAGVLTFSPDASVLKYMMSCGFTKLTYMHHGVPTSDSGWPLVRNQLIALPAVT